MSMTLTERQYDAQVLSRALNLARVDVWLSNIEGMISALRRDEHFAEAAFWGRAYADLLQRRNDIQEGADPRAEISTMEDVLDQRRLNLTIAVNDDEDRIARRGGPGPYARSPVTLRAMRRNAMKCFG